MTTYILDPSHVAPDEDTALILEEVTRRMCYTLHNHRSIQLGTGSATSRALRRVGVPGVNRNRKQVKMLQTCKLSITHPPDGVLLPEKRNIRRSKK